MTQGPFNSEILNKLVEQSMSTQLEVEDNAAAAETAITVDLFIKFDDPAETTISKKSLSVEDAIAELEKLTDDEAEDEFEGDPAYQEEDDGSGVNEEYSDHQNSLE